MNEAIIKVGISEIKLADRSQILRTTGLGSCVGVIIYDFTNGIAGMAHVMLPDSVLAKSDDFSPGKYANTAVPTLLEILKGRTRHPSRFEAKIAGGSEMFKLTGNSSLARIGVRNIEAVKEALKKYAVPLVAEDVGGNKGRTIEFSLVTGMLSIKTVSMGLKTI